MATYFLDTSALVKRQIAEPGHSWMQTLCDPAEGHALFISEAALTEVVATYARMARETPRRISVARRDRLIAEFDRLLAAQYAVVEVNRGIFTRAAALCRAHPLRAYDAIQLACALTKRDDDIGAGLSAPTFVCADSILLDAATAEGLPVENPNSHP